MDVLRKLSTYGNAVVLHWCAVFSHLSCVFKDVESAHLQELNAIQEQRDQAENLLMEEQRQRSVADMEFQQRQKVCL